MNFFGNKSIFVKNRNNLRIGSRCYTNWNWINKILETKTIENRDLKMEELKHVNSYLKENRIVIFKWNVPTQEL